MDADAPFLRIDLDDPVPAYRQITDGLRRLLVAGGELTPGVRLPTVRALASDLGVHHNTVAQAYRRLADEGWLRLVRGRGAVVCERAAPEPGAALESNFLRRLEEIVAQARSEGLDSARLARRLRECAERLEAGGSRSTS